MVIYDLKTMAKTEINENTVVALGTFDGCHFAHQSVLREAFYEAKRLGIKSLAYTFSSVSKNVKSIYTLEEKIKAISKTGIDYIAIDEFEEIKNLSPNEFFENVLLNKLKAHSATCGYNYKFGKGALANAQTLKSLFEEKGGSCVRICDEITINGQSVSSTLLRTFIENGEIERLEEFGTKYSVYEKVVEGKRLGKRLGFPTINQKIPPGKVVPKRGVYITECEIGEDVYPAITNVGIRPSIDDGDEMNMETYILGFNGMLYNSYIKVNFYKYLRGEIKFSSLSELSVQINKDKREAEKYFK